MTLNSFLYSSLPFLSLLAFSWIVIGILVENHKSASQSFALANLSIIMPFVYGIDLIDSRETGHFIAVLSFFLIAALISYKKGLLKIMKEKQSLRQDIAITAFALTISVYIVVLPSLTYVSSIAVCSLASYILCSSGAYVSIKISDEFEAKVQWLVVAPLFLMGATFGIMAISIFVNPGFSNFDQHKNDGIIDFFSMITIMLAPMNLGFLSLILVNLVKEKDGIALKDYLTGLPNRRYVEQAISIEYERSKRNGRTFSIMLIDIDNMKEINKELGQIGGDSVIISLSKIILDAARTADIIGRIGGEEFLIILPNTRLEGAEIAADRLRSLVECNRPFPSHPVYKYTVSIGVAEITDDETFAELLYKSDKALHEAKQKGRNTVRSYKCNVGFIGEEILLHPHHNSVNIQHEPLVKMEDQKIAINPVEEIDPSQVCHIILKSN